MLPDGSTILTVPDDLLLHPLALTSDDRKVLAAHQDMSSMSDPRGKWAKAALADLEAGLKAFGPVRPRRVGIVGRREAVRRHRAVPEGVARGSGVDP